MAAVDLIKDSIDKLQVAHDALHDYVAANASAYTPEINLLITANLSDMLTRIGNLDAIAIAKDAAVTLTQCQSLDAEMKTFADAAQRLEQTKQGIARSISFVNVGLQLTMYLAKADVFSAAKLLYTTLGQPVQS